jgi:hypothetical protein
MAESANDNVLMRAILGQVDASDFKVDYDQLAEELGASKGAVQKRWSRFKTKINQPVPDASTDGDAPVTPKAKATPAKAKVPGSARKGKRKASDDVDNEVEKNGGPVTNPKGKKAKVADDETGEEEVNAGPVDIDPVE